MAPYGLLASNCSARRCCGLIRRFLGATAIRNSWHPIEADFGAVGYARMGLQNYREALLDFLAISNTSQDDSGGGSGSFTMPATAANADTMPRL